MDIRALIAKAEHDCRNVFAALEENELNNTRRVLDAFHAEDIATRHFAPTTGYGYDDIGRDALERVFARLFGLVERGVCRTEDIFVGGAVLGRGCYTDRAAYLEIGELLGVHIRYTLDYAVAALDEKIVVRNVFHHDHKFIAANARDYIVRAKLGL